MHEGISWTQDVISICGVESLHREARVEVSAAMPEGCRALLGGEAGEERTDEE